MASEPLRVPPGLDPAIPPSRQFAVQAQAALGPELPPPPPQNAARPADTPPATARQETPRETPLGADPPHPELRGVAAQAVDQARYEAPPPPPLKSDVPRVALLLPLSGPHAVLGQALLNAAQLALFHFADKNFELLPQDTRGTAGGAADAVALAIGDGATLILGPLLSQSVEAVAPAARAAGVKVIAFSNDRRISGDGIFTMGFVPGEQVDRVVRYAYRKGLRNFALLAPDNDYGTAVADALSNTAREIGAGITSADFYDPLAEDLTPVVRTLANYDSRRQRLLSQRGALESRTDDVADGGLRRLKNLQTLGDVPFDALLIAEGGKRLEAIAALLPHFDIDPKIIKILGTGQWDQPGIGKEPALLNAWFAAPPPASRAEFITQYRQIYGKAPPRIATLPYDATAIAAVFARNDGKFDLSEILSPVGFTGRDGLFRFLPEGVTRRGLAIHQVMRGQSKVIDPAPTRFDIETN
ncbi:MAG: penicillin-binding protein activator [Rhodospirillales bacterium]|nr:penicillin-binding protein activator [Rhodospirillales bacterium]